MGQEMRKVRASAPRAALMKVCGRASEKAPAGLNALGVFAVAAAYLLIAFSTFAAESAKPSAVVTVRPPKPVVAVKQDGDKPALCPPTKPDDNSPDTKATAAGGQDTQKKDASGSTGNDLSVQLPSHDEKESEENRTSSSANTDSGDGANVDSSSMQVRLKDKDKDIDVAPAVAPAQCTIPGATQQQEPPH